MSTRELIETQQWRSTLAQVLVSVAVHTTNLNNGIAMGMVVFMIGALRSQEGDDLYFTEERASWFGGIVFVTSPVGGVLYGLVQDSLSRKTFMLASNVSQFTAYLVMYFSTSATEVIVAQVVIGLAIGFTRPASYTYLGEVLEARLRGTLGSLLGLFLNAGVLLATLVGGLTDWRKMVLYFSAFPVVSFISILTIPKSPAWLVLRGMTAEGERSYQCLRGWVPASEVEKELNALVNHVKSKSTSTVEDTVIDSDQVKTDEEKKSALQKLRDTSVRRPLRLIVLYMITACCAMLLGPRIFFKEVAALIHFPFCADAALLCLNALTIVGAVVSTLTMRRLGKRRLTFLSLTLTITSCLGLGLYVLLDCQGSWPPLILFGLSYFGGQVGLFTVPWILISEVFPLRARSVATGVASAACNFVMFAAVKTFYTVVSFVGLAGTFFLYGTVGVVGAVYLYYSLPETEGFTLEHIEQFFVSDKPRDVTART